MKKIILLIIVLLFISCDTYYAQSSRAPKYEENYNEFLSTLELPAVLSFCGEKIPVEIPEVRERAEREFYVLLQQPGQIILYIKRAGRYFPMFERIIREYNMPEDLKYLAIAESALYQARSGKGAVGMWQFIEPTAEAMGLVVNDDVDERRNPEKSTEAAMKYLKQGYDKLGSWTLTCAGYNMGHENVGENLTFQKGDDYYDLYLNEETSRYIFRIAIIKEILEHQLHYGFNIRDDQKYKSEKTKMVKVGVKIDNLSDWAISQGATYKDVKLLNPWILKRELPAPPKGGNWEIQLPDK